MQNPDQFNEWALACLEAAKLHRQEAVDRGFSSEAAEAMAVTYHSVLMAGIYEVDNPPPDG